MSLSILFANDCIQYVRGKKNASQAVVEGYGTVELDNDIVRNGLIVNGPLLETKLAECLKGCGDNLKKVDILLDNSVAVSKLVEVPILPHKKIMSICVSELKEFTDEHKEYLYDYSVVDGSLQDGKTARIFMVAIEKPVIESYINLFKKVNVKINSIDICRSAQINAIDLTNVFNGKTFLLGVLSENNLSVTLYVKGKFAHTNRSRVNVRNNLGIISEMSKALSSFIQYNRSLKNDSDVDEIYICGMTNIEKDYCMNISTALGIDTKVMPCIEYVANQSNPGYNFADYFYVSGNLLRR